MTPPSARKPTLLYVACTDHGFGHASRTASVVAEYLKLVPQGSVVFNSGAPEWFLDGAFVQCGAPDWRDRVELRCVPLDCGIVQHDSLRMDLDATLVALETLYEPTTLDIKLSGEAKFLRECGAGLVFADMPPLAAELAARAGIECWMAGNFGWDFIFEDLALQDGRFQNFAERMAADYARVDQLFQLPFSEPMRAFPRRETVGLTGMRPCKSRAEVLQRLGLTETRLSEAPLIVLSFGGLGVQGIPLENMARFNGADAPARTFVSFDRPEDFLTPAGGTDAKQDAGAIASEWPSNLILARQLALRPVDVTPLAERLLGKPGYGGFCEAYRAGTPFFCLERSGFAETPVLLQALQDRFNHRIVTSEEFFARNSKMSNSGAWDFLLDKPIPPLQPQTIPDDGVETIARALAATLQS